MTEITKEQLEILKTVIDNYGNKQQILKSIEETCEYNETIIKRLNNKATDDQVIDEIADVIIMMYQMTILFNESKIQDRINYKINRLYNSLLTNRLYNSLLTKI